MSDLTNNITPTTVAKYEGLILKLEDTLSKSKDKGAAAFAFWMEIRNALYQGMMAVELNNEMRDEVTRKEAMLKFFMGEYERCNKKLQNFLTIEDMITDETLAMYTKVRMEKMMKRKINTDELLTGKKNTNNG